MQPRIGHQPYLVIAGAGIGMLDDTGADENLKSVEPPQRRVLRPDLSDQTLHRGIVEGHAHPVQRGRIGALVGFEPRLDLYKAPQTRRGDFGARPGISLAPLAPIRTDDGDGVDRPLEGKEQRAVFLFRHLAAAGVVEADLALHLIPSPGPQLEAGSRGRIRLPGDRNQIGPLG